MEQLAETGMYDFLSGEADSRASDYAVGDAIAPIGSATVYISADEGGSLLSFASMVAPSPDWFIGENSIELYDDDADDWIDTIVSDATLRVEAYDAGSESGDTFEFGANAVGPTDNIGPIEVTGGADIGINLDNKEIAKILIYRAGE